MQGDFDVIWDNKWVSRYLVQGQRIAFTIYKKSFCLWDFYWALQKCCGISKCHAAKMALFPLFARRLICSAVKVYCNWSLVSRMRERIMSAILFIPFEWKYCLWKFWEIFYKKRSGCYASLFQEESFESPNWCIMDYSMHMHHPAQNESSRRKLEWNYFIHKR